MDPGALLREARDSRRLTQRALAARTGLPQSLISRVERGRIVPSLRTLRALLAACGWQLDARLVPLGSDVDADLARLAQVDVMRRLGTCDVLVPSLLADVARLGTVLIGGTWAAVVHGIPTHAGTPLLLSASDDEAVAALAEVLRQRMALLVIDDEAFGLDVKPGSLRRNPDAVWELPLVGRFRVRLLEDGEAWPTEVRVDTDEGPLRVVPAAQLGEADGVLPQTFRRWLETSTDCRTD